VVTGPEWQTLARTWGGRPRMDFRWRT